MSTATRPAATPRPHATIFSAARLLNPLVLSLAGTRFVPLYGVIEHRGRRSGKVFHTPVVVRPTSDGFIVPMPWGEADWYRNVRAAGATPSATGIPASGIGVLSTRAVCRRSIVNEQRRPAVSLRSSWRAL